MVLVLSGMWKVFCFCLSLEPDQEGLDSDALKTRGRIVIKGVVPEFDPDFFELSLFPYQNRNGAGSLQREE